MSKDSLKLAVIGCGNRGRALLEACEQIKMKDPGKFEFVAMCDVVEESAKNFAKSVRNLQDSSPKVYVDLQDMLTKENLDAAIIATHPGHHHLNAIACLEHGVNIMVEKPYSVTLKGCKAVNEAAVRNGKIACVATQIRHSPGPRTVRWLIDENKMIGDPCLLYAQSMNWTEPRIISGRPTVDLMMSGGGIVLNVGIHFTDTVRYLYGEVDEVYARIPEFGKRLVQKGAEVVQSSSEDTFLALMKFRSGLECSWSVTGSAPGYSYENTVHYFSKGCIVDRTRPGWPHYHPFSHNIRRGDIAELAGDDVIVQDGTRRIFYRLSDVFWQFMKSLNEDQKEAFFPQGFLDHNVLECYDFLDAIETKRKPEVDGEEALKSQAICEAIYESNFAGKSVKVQDVLNGKLEGYQEPINKYWKL